MSTWRLTIPPFPDATVEDLLERYRKRTQRRNIVKPAEVNDEGNLVIEFSADDAATAQKRARYIFCDVAWWPNNNSAEGHFTVEALGMNLRPTYQSPWSDFPDRIGEPFELLREIDPQEPGHEYDKEEVGSMYRIRFKDGTEITAWPEEIDADEIWQPFDSASPGRARTSR